MSVMISNELLDSMCMTEDELRVEIAVMLFEREKLTLEQASRLANMPMYNFQHLLASRDIPLHYDLEDFREDVETLRRLGRL
jgi:predicted HTH domain antitoxin